MITTMEEECFICLENHLLLKLNSQKSYYKKCTCDGFVHEACLDQWHDVKPVCPICKCKWDKYIDDDAHAHDYDENDADIRINITFAETIAKQIICIVSIVVSICNTFFAVLNIISVLQDDIDDENFDASPAASTV